MFGVISSYLHLWWKNIPTIPGMILISRTHFSRQGDVALRRFRAPFRCEARRAVRVVLERPPAYGSSWDHPDWPFRKVWKGMVSHWIRWLLQSHRNSMYILIKSIQIINLLRGKKQYRHFDPAPCVSTISSQSDNWLKWSQIGNASSFTQGNWMISTVPFVHWQNTLSTSCAFEQQTISLEFHPHHWMIWYVFAPLCTTLHHFAPNHTLNCARRGTCIRRPSIYQTKVGMYPIISQKKTGKPNFIKYPAISPFAWMVLAILKW